MRAWLVIVALCALGLAGCSDSDKGTSVASEAGKVTELTNVDTLRTAFSADDGKPRLLLGGFGYRMREWRHPDTHEVHWQLERRKSGQQGDDPD